MNDSYLEEFTEERDLVRAITPGLPVTTNFMGFFKPLDYFEWAAAEDVCSTDNYPDPADPDSPMLTAMHYDLIRSVKKDTPWMVMEQTTLRVNWRPVNAAKPPGEMRKGCYQALARDAAGLLFFQWRASRAGAEKFHSAMLPHAGTASPVWSEVTRLGAELQPLSELNASRVASAVAIAFSWPNWWALELGSKPSAEIQMLSQLRWMYRPVWEAAATADFVRPDADLSGYRLLLVPSLYLLTEAEASYIGSFVRSGGTAVISFWSGIVNESEQVYLGSYGGPLGELFGGAVLDVAPLQPAETVELAWADGRRGTATHWQDIIEPAGADVLARYASGPWAGRPAVLDHRYGQGRVIYLGTRLDHADMRELISPLLGEQSAVPAGVERVVRTAGPVSYEFLLNHSGSPVSVPAASGGTDLLTGTSVDAQLDLPPAGVAIIRRT